MHIIKNVNVGYRLKQSKQKRDGKELCVKVSKDLIIVINCHFAKWNVKENVKDLL